MSFVLMLAIAPAITVYGGPSPSETREFGDWMVGCDNTGSCTAIALERDAEVYEALKVALVWDSHPVADPRVEIEPPDEAGWMLSIDGRTINVGSETFSGKSGSRLAQLMAEGRHLTMKSAQGEDLKQASLAGLSAALLYIEDRQGRIGSRSAIIRPGNAKATGPRAVHATLNQPRQSWQAPASIKFEQLYKRDGCDGYIVRSEKPTVERLDSKTTLVLVPWRCQNGAYNFSYNVMIADNSGHLRPAKLDFPGGMSGEEGSNDLTNASWESERRRLIAHQLGRGTGDCGARNEYIWDGKTFRLALREVMPNCRGSMRFIPVWRADVVER